MAGGDVRGAVTDGSDSPIAIGWSDRARVMTLKTVSLGLVAVASVNLGGSGGEAQQTQLAMSLVLHRIPGTGSPRDFIRFSRCQFGRILNRSGFKEMFALGRGGAMADVSSLSWAVRPFHRFTKVTNDTDKN